LERTVGIPAEQIVVGNGLDEVLSLLAEMSLQPDDEVVVAEPTFSVYALLAARHGARVVDVGRDEQFVVSVERLVAAITPRTRLVFLCAPNNPTGTPLPRATLLAALERAEALADPADPRSGPLLVVDEAYYEFGALAGAPAAWTALSLLAAGRRLVVLRTFSKVFGLAGLRVGYACCPPEVAARLRARKQPYNTNVAGLAAARAALDDLPWLTERARLIMAERARLTREIADLGGASPYPPREGGQGVRSAALHVYPSAANFVLVEVVAGPQARDALWEGLLDRGILVRRPPGERLRAALRVTIGAPEENDRLLEALRELVREGGAA
jgi:histidinol-phosphate aminotransferase